MHRTEWRPQPREIKEVKEFLTTTRRKDARGTCRTLLEYANVCGRLAHWEGHRWCQSGGVCARIGVKVKKTNGVTKFKVRCSRFLYTFKVADAKKAEKIRASLPPSTCCGQLGLEFTCNMWD